MPETVNISPFPQGMNNIQKETKLPEGALRSAINVDITDDGSIRRRPMFSKIYSGVNISSLYKRFFVENGVLKYLNQDNTTSIVNSNIQSNDVSYVEINGEIYYSDGIKIFKPDHTPLGLSKITFFNATNTEGALPKGEYQISLCHRDSVSGELSGATNPVKLQVNNGGISITDIPLSDYETNIYISDTNGGVLYFNITVPQGLDSVLITGNRTDKHECPTLNMSNLPAGEILQEYNGILYSAVGDILWFSQPLRFGLCKQASDFFQFASGITIFQPVDNGLFIVADKTYFLQGANPGQAQLKELSSLTGIKGTGETLDGSYFKLSNPIIGKVAYWFSSQGAIIGLPDGTILEYSKERLAVPTNLVNGTTTYMEGDSIHKIITSMEIIGNGSRNSVGAGDQARATLTRNGIVIP